MSIHGQCIILTGITKAKNKNRFVWCWPPTRRITCRWTFFLAFRMFFFRIFSVPHTVTDKKLNAVSFVRLTSKSVWNVSEKRVFDRDQPKYGKAKVGRRCPLCQRRFSFFLIWWIHKHFIVLSMYMLFMCNCYRLTLYTIIKPWYHI